jgi:hypothetical protein
MFSFARHNFWLIVRCVIYALSLISAAVESPPFDASEFIPSETLSAGFVAITTLFFGGSMFLTSLIVSVMVSAPSLGTDVRAVKPWIRPTHATNPFSFSFVAPPLGFIHLSGFAIMASGLGFLLGAIFSGSLAILLGILFISFGSAILGGLYFGMACCKNMFQHTNEVA